MNKVKARCEKDQCAKFYYASRRMSKEVKALKLILYFLAVVTVSLSLIPQIATIKLGDFEISYIFTMISFAITIITEVLSSFISNHKEKAILLYQLYEAEITGSTFSKIEYDRENTNALNELAIRKGLPQIRNHAKHHIVNVPEDINDDYSYLYLARKNAANSNYLLDRMCVIYVLILALIIASLFAIVIFNSTMEAGFVMQLIIGFYPVVIPVIRNIFSCKKCQTNCVKICADIDNFFADGDASLERLARFYYYTQNLEFEMMLSRPAMYSIFPAMFKRGSRILEDGVTARFKEAVYELKARSKGIMTPLKGKTLITNDADYEDIVVKEKKAEERKFQAEKRAVEKEKQLLEEEKAKIEVSKANIAKKEEALKASSKTKTTKAPSKKPTSKTTSKTTSKKTTKATK